MVPSSNTAYMSAKPSILGSAKLRQGPGVVLIMLDLCLGRHLAARRGGSGRAAAAKSQKMNFVYEQDLVWRRPHDLGLEEARNGLECVLQPEIWDIRPTRSAALVVTRNLPARVNILPQL